jgi:branched-chain amino acid transport system ATP-binding protein
MIMAFFSVENLSRDYGGLRALNSVSLCVEEGRICALIGPNGAGKTTLFNIISCIERPSAGRIYFKNIDITNYAPFRIAALGIARTFQNLCMLENLTALENVMVGLHIHTKSGFFSAGFRLPRIAKQEKEVAEQSRQILEFMGLADRASFGATELPYGQQRLLEIARALATRPDLLLLDEPAAGLNSKETDVLREKIIQIRESGVCILLVEHDMKFVMKISDQITVLNYGEVIAQGSPREIQDNSEVVRSYLGMRTRDAER